MLNLSLFVIENAKCRVPFLNYLNLLPYLYPQQTVTCSMRFGCYTAKAVILHMQGGLGSASGHSKKAADSKSEALQRTNEWRTYD